jgi:hypothetical protein
MATLKGVAISFNIKLSNPMRKFFLLFTMINLILAQSGITFAQPEGIDSQRNLREMQTGGMWRSYDNRFKGIEGSPLLFSKYVPGNIVFVSGKSFLIDSINIDLYTDELLVKRGNTEFVVDKGLVKGFKVTDKQDSIHFVKMSEGEGDKYFILLMVAGEMNLYERKIKAISEPTNSGAYSSGRTYSKFIDSEKYYLKTKRGGLVELKNRKTLYTLFPGNESEIDRFIKENHLSFKALSNLKRLTLFLSTLP